MMKKRLLSLLLILALVLAVPVAALAAGESYIVDETGRISAEDTAVLQQLGETIRENTGAAVCVCITDETGPDLHSYAEQFWTERCGADEGIILVHNPAANMVSYAVYGDRLGSLSEEEINELVGAYNSASSYFDGAYSFMNLAYARLGGPGLEVPEERQYDRVVDLAGVIDSNTLAELNRMADEVSEQYACDVDVVFVRSLDGKYVVDYADDFYDYNGYGYGVNKDGILLLISVGDREFAETTQGYGATAFTDYGLQQYIEPSFTRYLVNDKNDWAGAARQFITDAGELLRQAKEGKPYDYYASTVVVEREKKTVKDVAPGAALISAIIGFFSGGIPAGAMKRKMKSVEKNYGAGNYARGGLQMRRSEDRFLYSNVHRTPIPREEHRTGGGGGGGSSMHFSSSGHSHGGSHGKF